ncbi:MAG: acetate--CoA ligase family protein [Candidatus Hadarchaeales archaeon]
MVMEKSKIAEILNAAKKAGGKELGEIEAKKVLALAGIPVNRTELATTPDEAVRIAREIHYPVVMKIASPDIIHKSDAGGVRVGIGGEMEVRKAFEDIVNNAKAYNANAQILGVTVQEHVPPGKETIVGGLQDKSFGPTVMFGLGGIWVEVLKDTSFRLAPLTRDEAAEMIKEIKGYSVLAGRRGEPPADIAAIADVIEKVGALVAEFPQILELDINPLFVFAAGKGAVAADARIFVGDGS